MFHCSLKIKGRVAVITGGGTGIGFMMATSLVVNGAKGIFSSETAESSLYHRTPRRTSWRVSCEVECNSGWKRGRVISPASFTDGRVPTDVTLREGLDHLVKVVSKEHNSLDMLFANGYFNHRRSDKAAGVLKSNPIYAQMGTSLEEMHKALSSSIDEIWEETFKTNVQSVYFTVIAFMPLLGEAAKKGQGRGSVVLTGSIAGIHWSRNIDNLAYMSSKSLFRVQWSLIF